MISDPIRKLVLACTQLQSMPSIEFELTANSLSAHIETDSGLIFRTLSLLTVNTQDELTLLACCELSVSLQLTL